MTRNDSTHYMKLVISGIVINVRRYHAMPALRAASAVETKVEKRKASIVNAVVLRKGDKIT